jgi:RNA polymerase sigma-70 factor (ECF subfamily)
MPPRSLALTSYAGLQTATGDELRLEQEVIALFDQFRDRLLRYLLAFGLTIPDGEEIVQEVFLALFQHLKRGRSRDNLQAWLFRVAHNLALKRRIHVRRHATTPGEVREELAIDPAPSPEERLLDGELRERLLGVLEALPELDRRCLALRSEGLRYREIAQVLEMSLGSVAASLARSFARMTRAADR